MTVAVAQFPMPTAATRVKGCYFGNLTMRFDGRPRLIIHVPCEHISEIGQIFGAPTARFCQRLYSLYMRLRPPQIRGEELLSGEMLDQNGEFEFKFLLDVDFIPPLVERLTHLAREHPFL